MGSSLNIGAALSTPTWKKVTKTYSDFSTAGLTNNIEIYSLAAGEAIHAVYVKHTTSFTGGLIATYTISVGITGTLAKYVLATNVFQAASGTNFGIAVAVPPTIENFGSATSIKAAATSTVGNLSAATQGIVDFYILTSKAF